MFYVWLAQFGILFIAPGPVGLLLGRWWWPIAVAGLVMASFFLWYSANTPDGEGGAGIVVAIYLLFGGWGTVTAGVGVWLRRAGVAGW